MISANKTPFAIAMLLNLTAIAAMVYFSWHGNDKAIIAVTFIYLLLLLVNATIWLLLANFKKATSKIFRYTTIGLLVLFIPTLFLAALY